MAAVARACRRGCRRHRPSRIEGSAGSICRDRRKRSPSRSRPSRSATIDRTETSRGSEAPDVVAIGRFATSPDLASVRPMPITPPASPYVWGHGGCPLPPSGPRGRRQFQRNAPPGFVATPERRSRFCVDLTGKTKLHELGARFTDNRALHRLGRCQAAVLTLRRRAHHHKLCIGKFDAHDPTLPLS